MTALDEYEMVGSLCGNLNVDRGTMLRGGLLCSEGGRESRVSVLCEGQSLRRKREPAAWTVQDTAQQRARELVMYGVTKNEETEVCQRLTAAMILKKESHQLSRTDGGLEQRAAWC